jgi:hypothetical protein
LEHYLYKQNLELKQGIYNVTLLAIKYNNGEKKLIHNTLLIKEFITWTTQNNKSEKYHLWNKNKEFTILLYGQ